ncbi:hypothetical protein [Streptomyces sp. NPDC096095]|uniref:hypothetical protein n=1 Tax=Streptomyces sp. NPDC096095 TaxID=3155545 RepID=UPI00331F9C8D
MDTAGTAPRSRSFPGASLVTAGQQGDSPRSETVLEPLAPKAGRPRVHLDRVRAGQAYASRKHRAHLRRRGSVAVIHTRRYSS